MKQAMAAARMLQLEVRGCTDVQIQTSPLFRTRQTAALVCEVLGLGQKQCVESPLLIEQGFGSWEGLTEQEIEAQYPGAQRDRHKNRWSYVSPGGESYVHVHERAMQWFQLARPASVTIVVTHAKMSRVLRGAYLGLKPSEILRLRHPQDRMFKLQTGSIDELLLEEPEILT